MREDVHKSVRHDLHQTLPAGGKPQIALIVRNDAAHRIVHRQLVQIVEAVAVHHADAVAGADPNLVAERLNVIDVGQRSGVRALHRADLAVRIAVIQLAAVRSDVDLAGIVGIRQNGGDALNSGLRVVDVGLQLSAAQGEIIILVCDAVEQVAAPVGQLLNVGVDKARIVCRVCDEVRRDHHKALRGGDIDGAVLALLNVADLCRGKAVIFIPEAELAAVHEGEAAVVRADPEAVLAVHKQALDAGQAAGGVQKLKVVAVIADQPAVAADPQKALFGLRNVVDAVGRQTVGAVVNDGGRLVDVVVRIDR